MGMCYLTNSVSALKLELWRIFFPRVILGSFGIHRKLHIENFLWIFLTTLDGFGSCRLVLVAPHPGLTLILCIFSNLLILFLSFLPQHWRRDQFPHNERQTLYHGDTPSSSFLLVSTLILISYQQLCSHQALLSFVFLVCLFVCLWWILRSSVALLRVAFSYSRCMFSPIVTFCFCKSLFRHFPQSSALFVILVVVPESKPRPLHMAAKLSSLPCLLSQWVLLSFSSKTVYPRVASDFMNY